MMASSAQGNPTSRSSSSPSLAAPLSKIQRSSSIRALKGTCGVRLTSTKGKGSMKLPSDNSSALQLQPTPQRWRNGPPRRKSRRSARARLTAALFNQLKRFAKKMSLMRRHDLPTSHLRPIRCIRNYRHRIIQNLWIIHRHCRACGGTRQALAGSSVCAPFRQKGITSRVVVAANTIPNSPANQAALPVSTVIGSSSHWITAL